MTPCTLPLLGRIVLNSHIVMDMTWIQKVAGRGKGASFKSLQLRMAEARAYRIGSACTILFAQ